MAAQIAHDAQGFLIGELIEMNKDSIATQQASLAHLRRIRSDVSAIASAMGISKRAGGIPPGVARGRTVVEPVGRESRSVASARAGGARAVVIVAQGRGANGRFVGSGKSNPAPGGAGSGGDSGVTGAGLEKLGNIIKGAGDVASGPDPALAAVGEVKAVLEPLGRGAFAMLGRNGQQKKERWYSRIWKALINRKADGGTGPTNGGSGLGIGLDFPLKLIAGIGTAIVSVLGVLGAGGIGVFIGSKIYEWLDKSGIATKVFDVFDSVGSWFKEKFSAVTAKVQEVKTNYNAGKNEALNAGGSNNAHRMMEDGNSGTAPGPITSIAQLAGRVVGSVQRGTDFMAGAGGRTARENKSLATANSYSAGNIGGLNDAQTRALVASTVLTESNGGDLGILNKKNGFMGRYQAGAGWLADAGLIKGGGGAVKTAMAADGFKSEDKWGESGGMTKFLKNDANWNGGMTYKGYLSSADVQDKAFKTNSDSAYAAFQKRGLITADTPPEEVAGLLKARHLAGVIGAVNMIKNGSGPSDSNGTSARKYYDDLAGDKNGFFRSYTGQPATTGLQAAIPAMVPMSVPAKIPSMPEISMPVPSTPEKDRPTVVIQKDVVGQNLSDRSIAHIASGGIGATSGW
ncbi:MAG: hypothetical protein H7293_04130 [Candidatus Saccharibacteria bacterium]|nr:hypothetical protein [Rhodoferax sp.]